jgi:Ser/Thr protein kinase RdoA (MazF antagonist)
VVGRTAANGQRSAFLPVTYSVIAPDSVAAVLADAYKWDAHVEAQLLWHGVNDTYLIMSGSGKHVVRVYAAGWRSPGEIIYELELLTHLSARGVAVAAPYRTRDGRLVHSLSAPEGERQVAVFAFVEGWPMSWADRRHSFLAGRLAAEVHRGSDNFTTRHRRPPLDLEHLIDQPLAAVSPFLGHRPGDAHDLAQCAAQLRIRAAEAIRGGLEWGVCHGDFGASNIHIIDGRSASVFDFDLCGDGWRAWDFVAGWAMTQHEHRPEIWESFVRGYTEIRPINPSDLAAVPLLHVISRLWSLGVHAQNAGYRGSWRLSDSFLDTYLTFFRRWQEGVRHGLLYSEPIS